ncbi:MAG TPA: hypothetical protein VIS07_12200 [Candidatus Binatia bacterium]
MANDARWDRLRYGPLLRLASASPAGARLFAALASHVEHRRDPERRRVAEDRIMRWLGATPSEAARIFRAGLYSEALEEADSARWMRLERPPVEEVELAGFSRQGGRPRIYGALHAGSPVHAYLAMRARDEPDVRIIARELDERNPMPRAKLAFAMRKVAWVERMAGTRFIDTDASAILLARDHLLAGRPLFAAIDVPGDVVARAGRVSLFGEPVLIAAGVFHLAAMTGADMQLVVSMRRGDGFVARCRPPIEGKSVDELLAAMAREMEAVIREQPGELWFWPYFVAAESGGRERSP